MKDRPELDEVEALASMKSIARLCRAFFKDLREEGFSPGESLTLTTAWLRSMLTPQRGDDA